MYYLYLIIAMHDEPNFESYSLVTCKNYLLFGHLIHKKLKIEKEKYIYNNNQYR
jgi:hypothetical protein